MRHRQATGFTLIELMIVVAIIGILAAIAYPAYQDQVRKGKRAEGQAALLDMMAKQERFYTDNNSYTTALTDLGFEADANVDSPEDHYKLSAAECNGSISSCVIITADPQFDDALCENLTYNSLATKGITGSGTVDNCW
ncbi:hypothetical protein Tel_00855 [Candidatus Tenderia electrophaga]|jgi:type IV pilus assembly protein PilE|uniref:Pilus assembly protein PilE n=1 Tax=Candidatus Tenderia electrophaga TaxID=1748243 RepID=A0A0S2T9H7_9GAMM|nr:hypothetical protein Tel_00855 [Candidatus Tenderia electrophaga]